MNQVKEKQKQMGEGDDDTVLNGSPTRTRRTTRLDALEAKVAALTKSSGTLLTVRAREELGIDAIPSPLELSNAQIIKEPWLFLLYAERHSLNESDLEEVHGEPPQLLRGLRASLRARPPSKFNRTSRTRKEQQETLDRGEEKKG